MSAMIYTVKIKKPGGRVERIPALARNWFEAWSEAVNTHGMRAVYSVLPHRVTRKDKAAA